jgi:hypothetical protein
MAVAHERDHAFGKIPYNWAQRLQPLDLEDHLVGAQSEAVAVQGEAVDGDCQVTAAPQTLDLVSIGDCNLQPGAAA